MVKESIIWEDNTPIPFLRNLKLVVLLITLALLLGLWVSGALTFMVSLSASLLAINPIFGILLILVVVAYISYYALILFFLRPMRVSSEWIEISEVKWMGSDVLFLFFQVLYGLGLVMAMGRSIRIDKNHIKKIEIVRLHPGSLNYYAKISDSRCTYACPVFDLAGFTGAIKKAGMGKKMPEFIRLFRYNNER